MKYFLARVESISGNNCCIELFLEDCEVIRQAKPYVYNWLVENDLLHVGDEFGIAHDGKLFKFTEEVLESIKEQEKTEHPEFFELYYKEIVSEDDLR